MATDILITDLTDGSLDANNEWVGTGVFDKLIAAVNKNIESQFLKDRLKGSDYANVYLGSMQAVLAQSVEYILREKQVEAQADLLLQQSLTEAQNTAAKTYEVSTILPKQVEKLDEEIDLLQNQDVSESTNRYNSGVKQLRESVAQFGYNGASVDGNGQVTLGPRTSDAGVLAAQENLYDRQKEAFDDNKFQKLFEAQLNYNGMVFQDATSPDVLGIALENRVNDIYNRITGNDLTLNTAPEA